MSPEFGLVNFMQQLAPELGHYYGLAYRYCYEDPDNSLVKLRTCASLLLNLCYQQYDLPVHGSLWERLQDERLQAYVPPYILDRLDQLRLAGNRGAHPLAQVRASAAVQQIALQGLKQAYHVAEWYHESVLGQTRASIPPFIAPNPAQSDQLYKDAILDNQAEAQYAIGVMFCQRAEHVTAEAMATAQQDACYWLGKAAAQAHAPALYQLGQLHLQAQGVLRNLKQAIQLITQAAELGYADAQYQLGEFYFQGRLDNKVLYEQDYCQALRYFSKAAVQEHPGALDRLVQMYYEGLGVKQNVSKAFRYAQKAAAAGDASAQFKLAYLYQSGLGTAQDAAQAFIWYQRAADNGDADAQVVMFKYYANGLQVDKNMAIALEWLHLAEAQNHAGACYYLALAYQRGIGVAVDEKRAISLLQRCIQFDHAQQYPVAKQALQHLTRPAHPPPPAHLFGKTGRNALCPCGSGLKYKKCCGK